MNLVKASSLLIAVMLLSTPKAYTQTTGDTEKNYSNLSEALVNPEVVYRLDLSNQDVNIDDINWSDFSNLKYLSLKDDHLTKLPSGIGNLKNLEVLDLSGNDFEVIPESFGNLTNLTELFLNDEINLKLEKNIPILSKMPNLRSLHIENDNLLTLPKNIYKLSHLESLYLNNNNFRQLPKELLLFDNLKFVDLHDNKFELPLQDIQNFGVRVRF